MRFPNFPSEPNIEQKSTIQLGGRSGEIKELETKLRENNKEMTVEERKIALEQLATLHLADLKEEHGDLSEYQSMHVNKIEDSTFESRTAGGEQNNLKA